MRDELVSQQPLRKLTQSQSTDVIDTSSKKITPVLRGIANPTGSVFPHGVSLSSLFSMVPPAGSMTRAPPKKQTTSSERRTHPSQKKVPNPKLILDLRSKPKKARKNTSDARHLGSLDRGLNQSRREGVSRTFNKLGQPENLYENPDDDDDLYAGNFDQDELFAEESMTFPKPSRDGVDHTKSLN